MMDFLTCLSALKAKKSENVGQWQQQQQQKKARQKIRRLLKKETKKNTFYSCSNQKVEVGFNLRQKKRFYSFKFFIFLWVKVVLPDRGN